MAVTFRDFFIGLSEQAPVVAQLVHDYTIWNYQKGMAERKFQLEKADVEAGIKQKQDIGAYYTKRIGMEEEEFRATFPSKVRTQEMTEEINRMAFDTAKAAKEARLQLYGSDKDAAIADEQRKIEQWNKNQDLLDVEIAQAEQSTLTSKGNLALANIKATREYNNTLFNALISVRSIARNPEDVPTLTQLFSKAYNEKTGELDDKKFYEELLQVKTLPIFVQNALANYYEKKVEIGLMMDAEIDKNVGNIGMNLYSTDTKTVVAAHSALGYKVGQLDLRDKQAVQAAQDSLTSFEKDQTFYKKATWYMNDLKKSLNVMGIPEYEEEKPPKTMGASGHF